MRKKNEPGHIYIFSKLEEITFLVIKVQLKPAFVSRSSSVRSLSQVCLLYQELTLYSSLMTSYFVYESELKNKSFAAFF